MTASVPTGQNDSRARSISAAEYTARTPSSSATRYAPRQCFANRYGSGIFRPACSARTPGVSVSKFTTFGVNDSIIQRVMRSISPTDSSVMHMRMQRSSGIALSRFAVAQTTSKLGLP
jgi:hypothetical protein